MDADIRRDAWRPGDAGNTAALTDVNRRGCVYRATAELALESNEQGAAFLAAYEAAWAAPHPNPLPVNGARERDGDFPSPRASGEREGPIAQRWEGEGQRQTCHAAAFGLAAARAGIALSDALTAYLQAFAGNLMSAGLRLGIVGQSDGQRILSGLETSVT